MQSIILTIVLFAVIIMIHEIGHFTAAKLSGVKVNEFMLGMGPTLLKKQLGETVYSIRLFPIGGAVVMEGDDATSPDPRAFFNKKIWQRAIIIVAGAVMNLVLGFGVLWGITLTNAQIHTNTIAEFINDATTAATGLQVGDTIQKINGRTTWVNNDIVYELTRDEDGIVDVMVLRDGKKVLLPDVQFSFQGQDEKRTLVIDFKVLGEKKSFGNTLSYSMKQTASIARVVWVSFGDLITGRASVNELAGPVGMTQVVGNVAKTGMSSLLMLLAFITINVGIFNLLPFPALDGGRLAFLLVEAIRKKPMNPKYEGYVHMVGFAAVILLMVAVTFNDIWKLFVK